MLNDGPTDDFSYRSSAILQCCWFVQVQIGLELFDMLVDTGSSFTLISEEIFRSLPNKHTLQELRTPLSTADGNPLSVQGQTEICMSLNGHNLTTSVVVANLGNLSGIIGLDFLVEYEVLVDVHRGILHSPYLGDVTLYRENDLYNRCAKIHLSETVHIPARSEMFVKGEIRGDFQDGRDALIEPLLDIKGGQVLLSRSVTKPKGSEVIMSVMNPTKELVILKKNVQVASLQPMEDVYNCNQLPKGDNSMQYRELPAHLQPLVENASSKLTSEQTEQLSSALARYADVFVGPDGNLGRTQMVKHTIDTGNSKPIKLPPRRLPIHQKQIAEQEINTMLEKGVIEPSNSPWAAPIVLVKKRDGSTRFCVDYRKLNAVTVKDAYPLPRIDESLDTLAGAKYFCTLDLASGYWQVVMDESDKQKTAFATHKGLYQFKVMPFGLSNSPATFERLMEVILSGLQWERCLVYIDDIITFGATFQQTLENLEIIFERLRSANLKLKPKKCVLFQNEVSFLGHIVSADGVRCNPDKISAIESWPIPTSVSDVRSFLGISSYYRRFIPDFSSVAYPLTRLTQKNRQFEWTDECETAFLTLKRLLTTAPILSYPSRDDMFVLDTDASAFGVGAVLSQIQDGQEKVIAYGSKTLSRSQMGYCTTYRELLAVVTFVKQFRHYLYGRPFLVRTDHASLIWLKNFKEPEGILARWISLLETFDFQTQHRKGSLHGNADTLSRKPRRRCKRIDCSQCSSGEDCSVNVVTATTNCDTDTKASATCTIDSNWLEQWDHTFLCESQDHDNVIRTVKDLVFQNVDKPKQTFPNQEINVLLRQWNLLVVVNDLLYRHWEADDGTIVPQLVAPRNIRKEIMQHLHDNRTSGHLGREKTLAAVKRRFYWPGMSDDVSRWCKTCIPCAKRKPGPGKGKSPMQHVTVYGPMECLAIDILGPLQETINGNRFIMVVGDYFSKWKEAFALPDHTAQTVADKLVTEVICRFGVPYRIHSDQGREFESDLFREMCSLLGIAKSRTTPYRPQSDGMVERYNRTLATMLSMFVDENRTNWDDHLPYVMMAYRASVHESTKCTPNLLMIGREISAPIDVLVGQPPVNNLGDGCPHAYVEWIQDAMQRSFEFAHENLQSSFMKQKRYHDVNLKPRRYNIGDTVWRFYPPKANQKLGSGWTGPYRITRNISEITYEAEYLPTGKKYILNVDHLKPADTDRTSLFQNVPDLNDAEFNSDEERSCCPDDDRDQDTVEPHFDEERSRCSDDDATDENLPVNRSSSRTPVLRYSRRGRLVKPPVKFSP